MFLEFSWIFQIVIFTSKLYVYAIDPEWLLCQYLDWIKYSSGFDSEMKYIFDNVRDEQLVEGIAF